MSAGGRTRLLTDEQWGRLVAHLPLNAGKVGRPFADHRRIVEGIIYRTCVPWRDLPRDAFGPWQTVWKRHRKWAADGTWDKVLAHLTTQADALDEIDWTVSVDSTVRSPSVSMNCWNCPGSVSDLWIIRRVLSRCSGRRSGFEPWSLARDSRMHPLSILCR